MKRGFALLETIIVITFVTVSLLLLYGTFTSLIDSKEKNILYDDASNIYQMYYLKEYLELNGLEDMMSGDIKEVSCDQFSFASCSTLLDEFQLDHLYLVKCGLKEYDEEHYTTTFNNYLKSLPNSDEYSYLLVGEFFIEDEYHYASIGVMHHG